MFVCMFVCTCVIFFVIATIQEELDPLGIALETVGSKNQEIEMQVTLYSANKSLSIHPLSMLLNGVIDAAVQGGVKNYDLIRAPGGRRSREEPEAAYRRTGVCVCVHVCVFVYVCVCMCVYMLVTGMF